MALGRQIALLAAVFAVVVGIAGCGGSDSTNAEIDPTVAADINAKLDQINERVTAGACTGDNSADSSLASLRDDVNGDLLSGEDEQFRSDLTEMLDQLSSQIDDQCVAKQETTTSSSTSTSTTTTSVPDTTTTDSTSSSTTKSTSSTTSTTTEPTTTTPTPPDNPPNPPSPPQGGGGGPGGLPGAGSGGISAGKPEKHKTDKPSKPEHGKKPKDDK